jgi:hypothetical protein
MKPAWWRLYGIGLLLVLTIGVIEAGVPSGLVRTMLESVTVILAFGLMLAWRHHNRAAFDLRRRR